MPYKEVALTDLLLDSENPRLVSVKAQDDLIDALLGPQPRKLLNLAKDIVEQGSLSPIDIPYVMLHRGKLYVVVEGNRRVAALKILANPDLASRSSVHNDFKKLAAKTNVDSKLFCAIAQSREEAAHWIELRHTGEREGAGVVDWNAVMRERFRPTPGTQSHKGLALADELERAFANDQDMIDLIYDVRETQLTLLGRIAADPDVRKRLGILFHDDDVVAHYTSKDLRPAFHRILSDISAKSVTSRSLNGKPDRAKYLKDIDDDLPDATTRSAHAKPLEPAPGAGNKPKPPKKPRKKRTKPQLLFPDLALDRFPQRLSEILDELNRLNLEQFPNSVAALTRVLIELTITDFYKHKTWQKFSDLKSGVRKCADHVDPTHKADELRGVRISLTDGNHFVAVKTIQQYLHNLNLHPSPKDLRSIALNYQYLLQQLNDRMPAA